VSADEPVQRIVVVGGGLAAWMAASALRISLNSRTYSVTVIDDQSRADEFDDFGGADATMPTTDSLNATVPLDEDRICVSMKGTFSLGIAFGGWAQSDQTYFHPFSSIGANLGPLPFQHIVAELRNDGVPTQFANYALAALAAQAGRFQRPTTDTQSVLSTCRNGLHIDCRLLRADLKSHAIAKGVELVTGETIDVDCDDNQAILAVSTNTGTRVSGELFIDCSGQLAGLTPSANKDDWQDWSQCLPCSHIQSAVLETQDSPLPFSYAEATRTGWIRHLPLQGRTVLTAFSSVDFSDKAAEALQDNVSGGELGSLQTASVELGRRRSPWTQNCIALGAAAARIDPLGVSNLQLLYDAINRLLKLIPAKASCEVEAAEYNRQTGLQLDNARDFAIAHYKLNGRRGDAFWDTRREMKLPDSLQYRIDLYASRGRVVQFDEEPLDDTSWINLFDENGVYPRQHNPVADGFSTEALKEHLERIRAVMIRELGNMPTHAEYLARLRGTGK